MLKEMFYLKFNLSLNAIYFFLYFRYFFINNISSSEDSESEGTYSSAGIKLTL